MAISLFVDAGCAHCLRAWLGRLVRRFSMGRRISTGSFRRSDAKPLRRAMTFDDDLR